MRSRLLACLATGAAAVATTVVAAPLPAGAIASGGPADGPASSVATEAADYVVLFKGSGDDPAARAAIEQAGGRVTMVNPKIGYAFVTSQDGAFATKVSASGAVAGAARNRVIGVAPQAVRARASDLERLSDERARLRGQVAARGSAAVAPHADPLANRQWDMRQIGATTHGSYAKQQGRAGVLVGVIDTGIDGTHPDIAANFNARLSHNFVTDNPFIDGPCEHPSCVDPVNEDDDGHGTHVASTIAAPLNGIGIAGVAPKVTLVNIRGGQDSGYFFLQPTIEAITYAGDIGVDVINMSFYTDPWLFNCLDNPADSPAERTEQRVIRETTQRAINYARNHGVLPVAAEGNEATNLNSPTVDDTSPDFPPGQEKHRDIDNSCISVPTETRGVVSVSATGYSTRKAYYSNYGTEQTDVAAPGGDYYDSPDNRGNPANLVLAAYPKRLARLNGDLDPNGKPITPFVVRSCADGRCAYYQYLQGTSMASPHAVGVASLIVSQYGRSDTAHGGLTLAPDTTQAQLFASATPHACPQPRLYRYTRIRDDGTVAHEQAYCAGPITKNGFYGHGIVNAYTAVTGMR